MKLYLAILLGLLVNIVGYIVGVKITKISQEFLIAHIIVSLIVFFIIISIAKIIRKLMENENIEELEEIFGKSLVMTIVGISFLVGFFGCLITALIYSITHSIQVTLGILTIIPIIIVLVLTIK